MTLEPLKTTSGTTVTTDSVDWQFCPSSVRRWFAKELELTDELAQIEVRAALMRKLADAGFVPTERWQFAFDLWQAVQTDGGRVPVSLLNRVSGWLDHEEFLLREEIEAFAKQYFELPCDARRTEWLRLQESARDFPAVEKRLASLNAGLDVDISSFPRDSTTVSALAKQLGDIFLLPLPRQSVRWQALQDDPVLGSSEGQLAANTLLANHPEIAALGIARLKTLGDQSRRAGEIARVRRGIASRRRIEKIWEKSKPILAVCGAAAGILFVIFVITQFAEENKRRGRPGGLPPTQRVLPRHQTEKEKIDALTKEAQQSIARKFKAEFEKIASERIPTNGSPPTQSEVLESLFKRKHAPGLPQEMQPLSTIERLLLPAPSTSKTSR